MLASDVIVIPLAAVGLLNAMMLAWATAAIIPILLHFLNRRRQRPIQWAAMQILLQVIQKEAKRMRIEQLLLLALRTTLHRALRCGQRRGDASPSQAVDRGS